MIIGDRGESMFHLVKSRGQATEKRNAVERVTDTQRSMIALPVQQFEAISRDVRTWALSLNVEFQQC